VHNPTHELRLKRLVRRLTGLPVTCGHELTTHLHAPRRALTVALNARLISLLQQLILGVRQMLITRDVHAPLMVVRGDGSLMAAKMALEQPVETILSGPAASVIGAGYLSQVGNAFVIDMGGTTTDIATLRNGRPVLNLEGAWVGGQRTMIEAVDVHTTGLGGDSEVRLDEIRNLCVGPRRVIPLSTPTQQEILRFLSHGPVPTSQLLGGSPIYRRYLDELVERGLVVTSAFTPTDAVHVLGQYRCGSVEAAELGAELWARRLGISGREFCKRVVRQVIVQAGRAMIASALAEEGGLTLGSQDSVGRLFIDRALGANNGGNLSVTFSIRRPLIGIGAPVDTYLPSVAEQLHTLRVLIRPLHGGNAYRAHLPFGVRDFQQLADAITYAKNVARRLAQDRAHRAGSSLVQVHIGHHDRTAQVGSERLYIETEVSATAVGHPQLKK